MMYKTEYANHSTFIHTFISLTPQYTTQSNNQTIRDANIISPQQKVITIPSSQMYSFPNPAIEGWIIIITGLHEESQEDDVYDVFSKYGQIKGIHLNMDRKTGYAKGYALI